MSNDYKPTLRSQINRYFENKDRLSEGLLEYIERARFDYYAKPRQNSNPITDQELALGLFGVFNIILGLNGN